MISENRSEVDTDSESYRKRLIDRIHGTKDLFGRISWSCWEEAKCSVTSLTKENFSANVSREITSRGIRPSLLQVSCSRLR